MEQKAPENIVRKVQALFEMAKRAAGNENEAAVAMAKAQELLAKYNMDISMVGERPEPGSEADGGKRAEQRMARTAQYKWQQKLAKEICEANFCWYWVQEVYETVRFNRHGAQKLAKPQRMKRHVVLGKEANRVIVEIMYGYLMDTIESLLPYPNTERLSRSAQSWREGCVDRLCERIREKSEAMKTVDASKDTESQTTALAVRSIHEAEYAANYDAQNGAGAYARMKQAEADRAKRQAEWEADWEAGRAEREAIAAAEREAEAAKLLAETPEQRERREKREAKEREKEEEANARWWANYQRQQQREYEKRDHSAYRSGVAKGSEIGLDSQLGEGARQGRLK